MGGPAKKSSGKIKFTYNLRKDVSNHLSMKRFTKSHPRKKRLVIYISTKFLMNNLATPY